MKTINFKITMENGGVMEGELYPEIAPETVQNFVNLVNDNFYDGLIFHRVIPGFMIQGGDPEGTGMGGSKDNIRGEFSSNGFKNDLKHTRGVLSMARSMDPNSARSQFFIMHQDAPHLDGNYAAFGKLTSGLEVVDEIANTKTGFRDKPVVDQVIKTIEVDAKKTMKVKGLAHIAVKTDDMEKTLKFYELLGGKVVAREELGTTTLVLVDIANFELEIIQNGKEFLKGEGAIPHIAILVNDVQLCMDELKEKGIDTFRSEKAGHMNIFGGMQNVFFEGPNGEVIELMTKD